MKAYMLKSSEFLSVFKNLTSTPRYSRFEKAPIFAISINTHLQAWFWEKRKKQSKLQIDFFLFKLYQNVWKKYSSFVQNSFWVGVRHDVTKISELNEKNIRLTVELGADEWLDEHTSFFSSGPEIKDFFGVSNCLSGDLSTHPKKSEIPILNQKLEQF